jgi:hypothetical protein
MNTQALLSKKKEDSAMSATLENLLEKDELKSNML